MKTGVKPKTWGEDHVIQEIRRRLRILRKNAVSQSFRLDYSMGYVRAISSALDVIRKVMHNQSRVKKINKKLGIGE